MNFRYLFFALFAVAVGWALDKILRYRGWREALFGAPVLSTVGELELPRRGMLKTRLKVHRIDGRAKGVDVGLEITVSTVGVLAGPSRFAVGCRRSPPRRDARPCREPSGVARCGEVDETLTGRVPGKSGAGDVGTYSSHSSRCSPLRTRWTHGRSPIQ